MPTIDLTLTSLHPAQQAIANSAKRFNVVCCGRRLGKTCLGVDRLIRPALEGYPVAWYNATNPMLDESWRAVKTILRNVIAPNGKNENLHRLELVTGGTIKFWSLEKDPDTSRGNKYKRVLIDEAAKVREMEYAWQQVIRPTLTDMKGDAYFLSTPKGMNFFKRCYDRGQDPLQPNWACWRFPTSANPYISPAEIEEARLELPERVFQQEYLAEFIEDAGGVFRQVMDAVDKGRSQPVDRQDGEVYTMGVDLARVEDFTVLAVVDGSGKQVYFDRFNQISWERQIMAIDAVAGRYRAKVYVDSTGVGDPIFERLRDLQLNVSPYQLTNKSKEQLINNLAMRIEQGHARLMDIPEQTNELLAYEYELTPSRNVRMNAPAGMHDDTVIALALAFWGQSSTNRRRHEVLL